MNRQFSYRVWLLLSAIIFMYAVSLLSCGYDKTHVNHNKLPLSRTSRVVIIGFQPALLPGEKPDIVRDPLSGATFMAEPVPQDAVRVMTDTLFERLVTETSFSLVSPAQAGGTFLDIVGSDQSASLDTVEILQKVGRAFDADAVLVGYLYRWNERHGSDYGVKSPASVAFDLHILKSSDGEILWRARFDKEQRSLSENLLDLETFIRGGGKWMTVRELALLGLKDLLTEMSSGLQEREDPKNAGNSGH